MQQMTKNSTQTGLRKTKICCLIELWSLSSTLLSVSLGELYFVVTKMVIGNMGLHYNE